MSLDANEDILNFDKKLSDNDVLKLSKKEKFKYKHKSYKRRWLY